MSGDDRRGFLRSVGRTTLALALGGTVAGLVARDGDACALGGLCHGCATLEACELPEGLAARQDMESEQGATDGRQT